MSAKGAARVRKRSRGKVGRRAKMFPNRWPVWRSLGRGLSPCAFSTCASRARFCGPGRVVHGGGLGNVFLPLLSSRARRGACREVKRTMTEHVSSGQLWEIAANAFSGVERFRVERVENGMASGTMVASGRAASFHASTLARHMRGARVVQNADGSPVNKPPPSKGRPGREPTASDYRRITAPRGLTPAEREEWIRDAEAEARKIR
jgi:hypothetical protein